MAGTAASRVPLCSHSWRTINFAFKASEKEAKFCFLPNLCFLFRVEPSVSQTETSHPFPSWEVRDVSSAREQLLRGMWFYFSIPTGV